MSWYSLARDAALSLRNPEVRGWFTAIDLVATRLRLACPSAELKLTTSSHDGANELGAGRSALILGPVLRALSPVSRALQWMVDGLDGGPGANGIRKLPLVFAVV